MNNTWSIFVNTGYEVRHTFVVLIKLLFCKKKQLSLKIIKHDAGCSTCWKISCRPRASKWLNSLFLL